MPLAPNVRVIHQTRNIEQGIDEASGTLRKLKVAAYARVSTEEDEQQSSYEAQMDYYTGYIKSKPEWEFAGIYADEGITGTSTKNRASFNLMIEDAIAGKIDLILVKSISRFARNVVDTLSITRKLRSHNVRVLFEKENLDTFDPKCETMLAIMATIAQEESRSISENVRWGIRKSMQDGKVSFSYSTFLGYEKGEDGKPVINEDEAKTIREIYNKFLDGYTMRQIADMLTERGVPTPRKLKKWSSSTIRSILTNEKYKGDALLQKTFINNYIDKKAVKNDGQLPQYYVEHSHPAIIDERTFELVQSKITERKSISRLIPRNSEISTKLICGSCGHFYGKKQKVRDNGKVDYYWSCNYRINKGDCLSPSVKDAVIKSSSVEAINLLVTYKDAVISKNKEKIKNLLKQNSDDAECQLARIDYEQMVETYNNYLKNRPNVNPDGDSSLKELKDRKEQTKKRLMLLEEKISNSKSTIIQLRRFINTLSGIAHPISEYNPELFRKLIDKVIVLEDKSLQFHYVDGNSITI